MQKFQGNSLFRASAGCSKLQNNKKYIQYSGKFQGTLCFSGQAQVAQKSWIIKKYIPYSEFRTPSIFQGKRKLIKNSEWKSIFHTAKNFWATLLFRASASCSKILNDKKYLLNTVKNIRVSQFFRVSASCSKILNVKSIFHTAKNLWATLFFRASASCSKFLNV